MTDKQRRFCDEYMANGGNAYQAALAAGYAEKTARKASEWIRAENQKKPDSFYNAEMAEYIAAHSGEMERHNARIATAEELQEIATRCARGKEAERVVSNSGKVVDVPISIKYRLKAVDMLAKMKGMYTTNIDANVNMPVVIMGYEDVQE